MKKIYRNLNKKAFWICLITSIVLLVAAFIVPPTAIIDSSIIAAVGELAGFATLAVVMEGINKGVDLKMKKGDIEVEMDAPDAEQ